MDGALLPRRPLLRVPGVARLFALSTLARTPEAAVGFLFILRVRELGGSFAAAGLVSAASGLSLAVGSPLLGRLIDRRGQTLVLLSTGVLSGIAVTFAALVPRGTPPLMLVPIAFIVGLCAPPIAPCLRSLFGHMFDGELRGRVLAIDAALQEVSFTIGPLVFVTAIGAVSPSAGLLAAGGSLLAGTLAFASSAESRAVPADSRRRPAWGALASAPIRTLVVVAVGMGVTFGVTEVGLVAVAAKHGGAGTLGLLVVVWSLPSLFAGLLVARHGSLIRDAPLALVVLTAGAGLSTATIAAMPTVWTVAICLGASGAVAAPMFAAIYTVVAATAPAGCLTEANTWVGSGFFVGISVGGAIGGLLVTVAGQGAAFVAGGIAAGVAALTARHRLRVLRGETRNGSPLTSQATDVAQMVDRRLAAVD